MLGQERRRTPESTLRLNRFLRGDSTLTDAILLAESTESLGTQAPNAGYRAAGYRAAGYPSTDYPSTGYPSTGYPSTGYPSTGCPSAGCSSAGCPSAG